ncbi:MAG: family 4 glycosyl hydrolase [Candidatus Flexifilum sp.]
MTRIVLIGAGSYAFGYSTFRDLFHARDQLRGSTVVLVDINPTALELMTRFAERLNRAAGSPYVIESTTDRRAALVGAQFVIISVAVKRNELWRLDFQIPLKHGVKQVLGENGGPGGLFHAMRNIPILLAIARDIEAIAPDAFVINFTNPEGRLCQALNRYTRLKFVGLCHGIDMMRRVVSLAIDVPLDKIDPLAGGLNHFSWVLSLRHRDTGEDLYPAFRAAMHNQIEAVEARFGHSLRLSRYLMDQFGYWPLPSDDHVGEYVSYAWEFCGLEGYPFDRVDREAAEFREQIARWTDGRDGVETLIDEASGERAIPIIVGMLHNTHQYELSVNVPNRGFITNLPDDAIVEIPAVVDAGGVHGVSIGALPEPIAAMARTQIAIIDRVVEAGVHGDRQAALQALLLDPVVHSAQQAEAILAELLEVHQPYLPQFHK